MSTVIRHKKEGANDTWEGVIPKEYQKRRFLRRVVVGERQLIIGGKEGSQNFHVRYFSIKPRCSSRLERHAHEHGVVIVRGKGRVQVNDRFYDVGPMDVVYVAGNDLHQFTNTGEDPFVFICMSTPR